MGCSSSSSVKAVLPTVNNKTSNFSESKNNLSGTELSNTSSNKAYKSIEKTLQKIIKVEKSEDNNDPIFQLIRKLDNFKKSIQLEKGNFTESFDTLQLIYKNLANNFSNPKFKCIKKNNQKFKQLIGKYKTGMELMSYLGFKDQGEQILFSDKLPRSYVQMKIIDLNIAYNKVNT
jgi:PUB domain